MRSSRDRIAAPTIFFDLDGVLADSRKGIVACVNRVVVELGLAPFADDDLERIIGPPLSEGFRTLLTERGAGLTHLESCVTRYRELYATAALAGGTAVQAGIPGLLDALATDFILAVATSKPLRFAEPILESLGLRGAFRVVAGPSPENDGETKTRTLQRAVESLGRIDGTRAWMVGDRHHDVAAALANGIVPIGVTWGFGTEAELRDAGARVVVDDPFALLDYFRAIAVAT